MSKNGKAIVSLSGGIDSATVLAFAIQTDAMECHAIGFVYGSKHNEWENKAAHAIAEHYGVPFELVDLSPLASCLKSSLLLNTTNEIPEGHYEAETMRQTVVPGRNSIFAAALLGIAQSQGACRVYMGIHAGDHHIYPDCRPEWFDAMQRVYRAASEGAVHLEAPLLNLVKSQIVYIGTRRAEPPVPWHLTRTCYKHQPVACGRCGSCQERLEAFARNRLEDPIEYQSRELISR